MAEEQQSKIIVDTDWKSQAQAEKERLAAAEKAKAPPARPAEGAGPEGMGEHGAPLPTFEELVRMLATQALLYLGAFPDPETGRRVVSLELAQFNIDMLAMLEEKTKGNLGEEEKTFISHMLHELRMQYVQIGQAVAKAVQEGRIAQPGPAGGPAGVVPPVNIRPPQG
jgi:hypothetical protein